MKFFRHGRPPEMAKHSEAFSRASPENPIKGRGLIRDSWAAREESEMLLYSQDVSGRPRETISITAANFPPRTVCPYHVKFPARSFHSIPSKAGDLVRLNGRLLNRIHFFPFERRTACNYSGVIRVGERLRSGKSDVTKRGGVEFLASPSGRSLEHVF